MNFLLYKEYSAENLQFFLWHQDYVGRFAKAPSLDYSLAPEWTKSKEDEAATIFQKEAQENMQKTPAIVQKIFKGTDFEKKAAFESAAAFELTNPFSTPPASARRCSDHGSASSTLSSPTQISFAATHRTNVNDAFAAAGAKTPCKLPFCSLAIFL